LLVLLADRLDCLQSLLDLVLSLLSCFGLFLGIKLLNLIIVLFGRLNNIISILLLEKQGNLLLFTGIFVRLALLLEDFVHFLGQGCYHHLVEILKIPAVGLIDLASDQSASVWSRVSICLGFLNQVC